MVKKMAKTQDINSLTQMKRWIGQKTLTLAVVSGLSLGMVVGLGAEAQAQTFIREGKLQFVMLEEMSNNQSLVFSSGVLADLQTDPNFDGDFDVMFNEAATILNDYTPVVRGGYFPENAGIPREQQVTVDEAVYRLFRLDSGNELMLYRSPMEDTSRYFIRRP